MKVLADTHLLLWWAGNEASLSRAARLILSDPENTIFVSVVSLWEIRLKQSLGKLSVPPDFEALMASEEFEVLSLTAAHTAGIAELAWHHRDPFDRMLVAQAIAENLVLLTADVRLAAYGSCVRLV